MTKKIVLTAILFVVGVGVITLIPTQASAETVSLTGTVTAPDEVTPIANAGVQVHNGDWSIYQYINTDSLGEFSFYDLPANNYTIEVWGNSSLYSDPDSFEMYIPGDPVTDIGVIALLQPNIQITLTKSDGTTPVTYAGVDLRKADYSMWKYKSTDENGIARFGIEETGDYVIEIYSQFDGESPPDPIEFTYSGADIVIAAQYKTPNVYGYILRPDETPCTSSDCSVNFNDTNWQNYYWANPDENGYFSLSIDESATYNMYVSFWGSGNYSAPDPSTVVIDGTGNNNLGNVYLLSPNITGTLLTPTGDPVENASFDFYNNNWTISKYGSTDANGDFGIAISTNGSYKLRFWISEYDYPDYAAPREMDVTYAGSAIDLGNISLTQAVMKGKVTTEAGSPIAWASVDVHDSSYSWENSYWGSTNENGEFTVNKYLSPGTYYVDINPPWDQEGLLPSEDLTVEITEGQTNTDYYTNPIELGTAKKKITGTVSYPDGRPVTDASINSWALGGMYGGYAWSETDSQGQYTLWVGKGSYGVGIWPNWSSNGDPDWGSPGEEYIEFTGSNSIAETATVNFTVAEYNSTLSGKIVMPNGDPIGTGMSINIDAWEKGGRMGNWANVDSAGNFSMKVAGGRTYEINIWAWDYSGSGQDYAGPAITPVTIENNTTHNLGTIKLVEKNAHITGKVTDTNGSPIENAYVDAWSMAAGGWGWDQTDSDGEYDMLVFGGNYHVHAFPSWESSADSQGASYVPISGPQEVAVQANTTISDINFQMGLADATIKGHLETVDGDLINTWGWVNASNSMDTFSQGDMWYGGFLGASLQNGQFSLKVPSGKYNLSAFMDWNSDYIQDSDVVVSIESGETKDDVVITMLETNSLIQGQFKDSSGNVVYGLWGQIFGDRAEGGSTFSNVRSDGNYSLKVAEGTWNLDYWLDPWNGAGYLPSSLESTKVTIGADETVTLDFTVLKTDSGISGVVKDNNDNPIEGAYVYASLDYAGQARDDSYMHYGFDSLEAISDSNGEFSLLAPEGEYYIHASLPPSLGYIFTGAQLVYTSPNDPAEDIEIVFESSDAQISGTVSLDGSGNEAFIYAYTSNGGYSEADTSDGSYTMPVTKGKTWNIGAIYETGTSYYISSEARVVVDENEETQNLALVYTGEMPEPSSSTFDATQSFTLELEDGFSIKAPARAFANEGYVTLTVKPTAKMAYQAGAQPLQAYGYEITVRSSDGSTIANFNSNVTLTLPYTDAALTALGLTEDDLSGEFFNTSSGSWEEGASVIVDKDNNLVIIQTDHFSVYNSVTPGVSVQSGELEGTIEITVSAPLDNTTITSDSVVVSGTVSDLDATVTIRLNGVSIGAVDVDSSGNFTENISGFLEGDNTVRVNAVKGVEKADTISRTVIYSLGGDTPIDSVTGDSYDIVALTNEDSSPQVRIFNSEGVLQNQFFTFSEAFRGEFRVLVADINGDNESEIIAWSQGEGFGPQVRIFTKQGTLLAQKMVLNEGYRSGIDLVNNVDLDGDGRQDFIIVPRGNGGTNLRAYKYNAQTGTIDLLAWTMAYQEEYEGLVKVVTADVTGDSTVNIITSPLDGGPNVRVFHYDTTTQSFELDGWFMAYQEEFRGGVLIATGDVNGDGQKDIITYPEENGGANIRAYTYNSTTEVFELIDWIQPFGEAFRGTATVKVFDLDKDGQAEIITAPAVGGGPNLRVYSYDSTLEVFTLRDWEMVFAEDFRGGVGITISNMDGDGYREVVVYPLHDGGPNIRVYEYNALGQLTLVDWTLAYSEDFRGELNVSSADLDGDGVSSLIITPLNMGGPNLRILNLTDGSLSASKWFMAYAEAFRGGVLTKFIK